MINKYFKDIPIGGYFGCWGDIYLNYNSPTWLICKKDATFSGVEINKDGSEGQRFCIDDSDELKPYSSEEILKLLEEKYQ